MPHSWSERSVNLGPGLLRLPDGTYRRPSEASFHLRCLGPLAHWEVEVTLDLSNLPEGKERLYFLYPLPPQASISLFELTQDEKPLGPKPRVTSTEQLPEETQQPLPSKGMLETFGSESLPVLSLVLDSYLQAYQSGKTALLRLVFGSGLPTVDGRIRAVIPAHVEESLQASGSTAIKVHVEIEDGDELVDEPISSEPLEQRKVEDVFHLEGSQLQILKGDLEITFRPGRTEMPVTRLRRSSDNFLFSIFPPTSIPASPQRRDLIFCVDASENVLSGLFESIRDDLCSILRKLDDNDRFALVTYGRDIDGYEGGEFCEVGKAEEACRWLHTVEPKGRPDISPLLARIQALPSQPDRQLCVFLLAAGHVGNEPSILKSLDFDQSDRRYYAVGIGSSVQQAFLRRLALLTRGRCEVAPAGHCTEALERLLGQTRALLAEVTFETQDGKEIDFELDTLVPSRMTSLTAEGPVHCFGKGSPSSLRFRSKDETGVFFAGTVNARNTENPALSGVWAGLRVREMVDSVRLSTGAKRKQLRAETSALASDFGILVEDTVLVLETDEGLDVQLSALPYRWRRGGAVVVTKSSEETAPAFDWRKGLKARDGLFKGAKPGEGGESSGEVRHGLRRPGELGGRSLRDQSKPMLDRHTVGASSVSLPEESEEAAVSPENQDDDVPRQELLSATEPEAALTAPEQGESASEKEAVEQRSAPVAAEVAAPVEPVSQAEPSSQVESELRGAQEVSESSESSAPGKEAESASVAASVAPPVVSSPAAALPKLSEPVFHYSSEPWGDAKQRLDSYLDQAASIETRMALASLAALPSEVSQAGPDLPRILAQTVGHLEKRGYFSAAVSVLGLLLKEYSSPEVVKKMESLLVEWANSLEQEKLPEAIHILQAGLRICPGSEALTAAMTSLWQSWSEQTEQQRLLPELAPWREQLATAPSEPLLASGQLELAKLQQKQLELQKQQQAAASEIASLRKSVEDKLDALPALLETLLEARPGVVQAPPAPTPVAASLEWLTPTASSSDKEPMLPVEVFVPPQTLPTPSTDLPLLVDLPLPGQSESHSVPESDLGQPLVAAVPELGTPPSSMAFDPVTQPQTRLSPPEERESAVELAASEEQVKTPTEPSSLISGMEPLSQPDTLLEKEEAEESGESLNLTKDELLELLQAEPRDESGHRAVKLTLSDVKERINFYRDLVRLDAQQPHHSLSLARAYREAEQTKVAVVHYQKYLRSEKSDAAAYLELAEAYDELGKSNLSISARKAAELLS